MSSTALSDSPDDVLFARAGAAGAARRPAAMLRRVSSPRSSSSAVVQMYGAGLERIVGAAASGGERGPAARRGARRGSARGDAAADPRPASGAAERAGAGRTRARCARTWSPTAATSSCCRCEDGVARIRLRGSCSDCSASAVTLELAIKQALEEAAPDLEGLEVEGVAPAPAGASLPLARRWRLRPRQRPPALSSCRW